MSRAQFAVGKLAVEAERICQRWIAVELCKRYCAGIGEAVDRPRYRLAEQRWGVVPHKVVGVRCPKVPVWRVKVKAVEL